MTVNVTALPEAGGAPLALRTAQQPLISAAGVNDAAAVARQQLPSAVPAPAMVAAYLANMPHPPKPALRAVPLAPSSALAAQFIAQDSGVGSEELAVFVPRALPGEGVPAPAEEAFVSPLRAARAESATTAIFATEGEVAQAEAAAKAAPLNESLAGARGGSAAQALGIPALISPFHRALTLTQARGVGAYQLAQTRNALSRKAV